MVEQPNTKRFPIRNLCDPKTAKRHYAQSTVVKSLTDYRSCQSCRLAVMFLVCCMLLHLCCAGGSSQHWDVQQGVYGLLQQQLQKPGLVSTEATFLKEENTILLCQILSRSEFWVCSMTVFMLQCPFTFPMHQYSDRIKHIKFTFAGCSSCHAGVHPSAAALWQARSAKRTHQTDLQA